MDPVPERLRARASASRSRVEGLRSRIAVLEKEFAEEEEQQLSRWAVAEEAVSEPPAENDDADSEEASTNIRALSQHLGRSDPGFTLRTYTHLVPSSEERTRRALDDPYGARSDGE